MTTKLEEELTFTLEEAADRAPEPDETFLAGIRRRQRTRKRRRVAAVAACAAVLTVASGLAAVRLTPTTEEGVPVATWSGTVPDFDAATSPDKVWPHAVHRLPARLPDGSEYQVYAVLDNDRYLVRLLAPELPNEIGRMWAPWVFDTKAGTLTFLGQQERPEEYAPAPDNWFGAVGDYAIWLGNSGKAGSLEQIAEGPTMWVARLDGQGGPRRLADPPNSRRFALAAYGVTRDAVYWYAANGSTDSTGIYRVPLSGGAPELLRGSEGYGAGYSAPGLSPWVDTMDRLVPRQLLQPSSGELENLDTGERRPWRTDVAGVSRFNCGPLQCKGQTASGRHFVQRLDGTGFRELPYPPDGFHPGYAAGGRFGLGTVETPNGNVWYVWDLVTGQAATVSDESPQDRVLVKPGYTPTYSGFENSTLQWQADEKTIYVLDLKSIP